MEPMRAVLAAKFWNQEVESTRSLDALVYSVPSEPPPLGLVRGSKLSRSQQLLLLQRLFRVPFTPSVEAPNAANQNCGGVVLDRVLASAGGSNWWATVTGRMRAQRFWLLEKRRAEGRVDHGEPIAQMEEEKWWYRGQRMLDSSLYALSLRSRLQLSSHTFLTASSELDSVEDLFSDTLQDDSSDSEGHRHQNPWRGRVCLRHKAQGHDWILETAYRGHFVDREARYWEVPQVTTLDLASVGSKGGGLRYRLGLHHSSGDPIECQKEEGRILGEVPVGARAGLRAQGAFSVEKELHLWKKTNTKRQPKKTYNLLSARPRITLSGIVGGLVCAQLSSRSQQSSRDMEEEGTESGVSASALRPNFFVGQILGPVSADLFSSLGFTTQFGLFQRILLDHTKVGVRLDVGAASSLLAATRHSEPAGTDSGTINPRIDNGFPTVALSLQQQLVGPLCARVDSRFSLDPANMNIWPPHLQEVTYGVDCSLEKLGAAKVVVWYSPFRKEGMAELRILER